LDQLNAFQSLVVRLSDDKKKVDDVGIAALVHVLEKWIAKNVYPGNVDDSLLFNFGFFFCVSFYLVTSFLWLFWPTLSP
jgi:hypothetical protein